MTPPSPGSLSDALFERQVISTLLAMHDPEQQKNKFTPNIQSKSPISDDITYEYIAHTLTLYHLSPSSQDPKGKNECIKWKSGEEMHSIERIKKNRERKNKHSELNTMQS